MGHISGAIAIRSGDVFKGKDERLKELDDFVSRRSGGQQRAEVPAPAAASTEDADLDSDDETELMTSLLTGPRVRCLRCLRGVTTDARAGAACDRSQTTRLSSSSSISLTPSGEEDQLIVGVRKALANTAGGAVAKDLRVLLKLVFDRMRAAERRVVELSSSS